MRIKFIAFLAALLGVASLQTALAAPLNSPATLPRVFVLDARELAANRALVLAGDRKLMPALSQLERDAGRALKAGPFSVTFKQSTPPSGDKHDYMSQAPYFWPNPGTSNGLPYVRHDGRRNPEINRISDHRSIGRMCETVRTLALAYYFTGKAAYASKATELIRAWFLDPATRMNPNFNFAQGIPGITSGRSFGLIESRGLPNVVDAVGLIAGSKAWTAAEQHGLEEWFSRFLQWMRESKNGRRESAAKNNHGTYYDLQVVSYALFLGRDDFAKQVVETAKTKRIARQIEPDGREPLELARTNAWGYSVGNLEGLMTLADLGERAGADLWHFTTPDGCSIRKALDYLAPFALDQKEWPYRTSHVSRRSLVGLIRRAASHYHDPAFEAMLSEVPPVNPSDRLNLLVPANAWSVKSESRP